MIGQFRPKVSKTACGWSIWTRTNRNGPLSANLGRFGQFGSKLANHGPFWWVRAQIDQSQAVLVSWCPNWLITGRFGRFGSKLTNHRSFWAVQDQIDQSRAVLVSSGPNWLIIGRFGQFGPKLANHGLSWSIRALIGLSRAFSADSGSNWTEMFWFSGPVSYQIELWSIKTLNTRIVQISKFRSKVLSSPSALYSGYSLTFSVKKKHKLAFL